MKCTAKTFFFESKHFDGLNEKITKRISKEEMNGWIITFRSDIAFDGLKYKFKLTFEKP